LDALACALIAEEGTIRKEVGDTSSNSRYFFCENPKNRIFSTFQSYEMNNVCLKSTTCILVHTEDNEW